MIPNMFKIAGELTSTVFHVSARSLACQALSIFGDHSDVMAVRSTGFALLASNSVQEVMDTALIAQAATLEARVPFLHFFDGFRTSHEVNSVERVSDEVIRAMIDDELVLAHRSRGLSPDHPVLRGTAQNPDVYFQGRETVNPFYAACPAIVQKAMDKFAKLTGRQYRLFDYVGAKDAERVIVMMGSGAEAAHEAVDALVAKGEKVGLLKVRLFRPFSVKDFVAALPASVKSIAVLDRTKEPGAAGEPLYQDVVTALVEAGRAAKVVGGRYGLSSKEFTPGMVKAVFDNLSAKSPKNHFTVGIKDDVSKTSLDYPKDFITEPAGTVRCMFYGLGSDGTVGANKNSIKIIGEETDNYRPGLLRLRLQEGRHDHGQPPALRSKGNPLHVPGQRGGLHRLPRLHLPGAVRRAQRGRNGRDLPAEQPLPGQGDMGPPAQARAAADHRQEAQVLRHQRLRGGQGDRHGRPHQHDHADVLLRPLRHPAAGRGHRHASRMRSRRPTAARARRSSHMNYKAVDQAVAHLHRMDVPAKATSKIDMPPVVAAEAPGVRQGRDRHDHGRQGRRSARLRHAGRRHLAHRHHAVGEAEHRPGDSRCGTRRCASSAASAPWPARTRPSALKAYDPALLAKAPKTFKIHRRQGQGVRGQEVDHPGRPGRLHRLRHVRAGLPGQEQAGRRPQGHQHGRTRFRIRAAERENYAFFLSHPGLRPQQAQPEDGQGQPALPAAV